MKCDLCGKDEGPPLHLQLLRRDLLRRAPAPGSPRLQGRPHPQDSREPDDDALLGRLGVLWHVAQAGSGSPYLFSQKEVRDIIVAWAALALAFTIAYRGGIGSGGSLFGGGFSSSSSLRLSQLGAALSSTS